MLARMHGELVCGPETLSERGSWQRCDFGKDIFSHPLDDDYLARSPKSGRR